MHRDGSLTRWGISPAGRRVVQSIWQRHLLQSWWSSPHYDVTEIRAAMHTHLRMMQKYFMIQRMCSRVMAKNIFNKKSILHMENGGYQSFDIIVWFSLLFYHGYIWKSMIVSFPVPAKCPTCVSCHFGRFCPICFVQFPRKTRRHFPRNVV